MIDHNTKFSSNNNKYLLSLFGQQQIVRIQKIVKEVYDRK